jgi:uncharacterized protein YecT (DUF1311 family)
MENMRKINNNPVVIAAIVFCCLMPVCWCFGGDTMPDYMSIHKYYEPQTCSNANTQKEMDQCRTKSLEKSRRKMVELVNQIKMEYKESEPKLLEPFIDAQNAWNAYAEKGCRFSTYYSWSGSGYQSILNECLEKKILERISYLEWVKNNP